MDASSFTTISCLRLDQFPRIFTEARRSSASRGAVQDTRSILMSTDKDDERSYVVLKNDEEQYSLWPLELTIPAGWQEAGKRGTKAECLEYVDKVWIDMRPLSLRRRMSADA
jgi:MbtH protein